MKINHIGSVSRILIDLCVLRQKPKKKNTFADFVDNVLVVKKVLKEY